MKKGIYAIEVVEVEDHEDGSATLQLNMSSDTQQLLIEAGLISLIKKYLDEKDIEIENESKTD